MRTAAQPDVSLLDDNRTSLMDYVRRTSSSHRIIPEDLPHGAGPNQDLFLFSLEIQVVTT